MFIRSVWIVPPCFQDIPTHLTTPMKSHSNATTPYKPLSTSDPSCYGAEVTPSVQAQPAATLQATPFGLMATPVEMIMGSCSGAGRLASNFAGQAPSVAKASAYVRSELKPPCRSPFTARLRTPSVDARFKVRLNPSLGA